MTLRTACCTNPSRNYSALLDQIGESICRRHPLARGGNFRKLYICADVALFWAGVNVNYRFGVLQIPISACVLLVWGQQSLNLPLSSVIPHCYSDFPMDTRSTLFHQRPIYTTKEKFYWPQNKKAETYCSKKQEKRKRKQL